MLIYIFTRQGCKIHAAVVWPKYCRCGVKHYNNQSINQSTPMRVAGWIFNSWRANMIILQNNAKCNTCLEFLRITNLLRWLTF